VDELRVEQVYPAADAAWTFFEREGTDDAPTH
jgi:hypothetical protein